MAKPGSTNHCPDQPPVHNLSLDVLLFIFTLNAEMDPALDPSFSPTPAPSEHHPLSTTRDTSHVCSAWRTLIVSSPSLWARMVDVGYLSRISKEWREEILRRTGDALLTVKVGLASDDEASRELLAPVLHKHWKGVESLDLLARGGEDGFSANAEYRWPQFYQAAPSLRSFKLRWMGLGRRRPPPIDWHRLFGSVAPPRLQEFVLWGGCGIDVDVPWLSRLRSLEIRNYSEEQAEVTLSAWLTALSGMPELESLVLHRAFSVLGHGDGTQPQPPLRSVRLRSIKNVEVYHGVFGVALLLAHLEIPPQSGVVIVDLADGAGNSSSSELAIINGVLRERTRNWVDHQKDCTALRIDVYPSSVVVEQCPDDLISGFFTTETKCRRIFEVNITSRHHISLLPSFLDTLAGCNLDHITSLRLSIVNQETELCTHVRRLLDTLKNVDSLVTNMETLDALMKIFQVPVSSSDSASTQRAAPSPPYFPFPKLQTLNLLDLQVLGSTHWSVDHGDEVGRAFFMWRHRLGAAIKVLDLTQCGAWELPDMGYLEDLALGMRVLWMNREGKMIEYVCGEEKMEILWDLSGYGCGGVWREDGRGVCDFELVS